MSKKGFTLIELIIVVIIVGILAAIAAPMMSSNVAKARRSEAVAAVGTLRTAARLYYVEHSGFPAGRANLVAAGYIADRDLNGPNYNAANYTVTATLISADNGGTGAGWVNMDINTGALTQKP